MKKENEFKYGDKVLCTDTKVSTGSGRTVDLHINVIYTVHKMYFNEDREEFVRLKEKPIHGYYPYRFRLATPTEIILYGVKDDEEKIF